MSLRQVSRDLRSTVDGINFVFKKVSIIVEKFKATMTIDGHSQVYERQSTIDWDHDLTRNYHSNIKRMFTDLKVLSHLPKLLIDHLHITNNQPGIYEYFESIYIDDGNEDWLHFERFFDNLKQFLPVSTEKVKFYAWSTFLAKLWVLEQKEIGPLASSSPNTVISMVKVGALKIILNQSVVDEIKIWKK